MKLLNSAIFFSLLLAAAGVTSGCSIDKNMSQNSDEIITSYNANDVVPSKTMSTKTLTVTEFNQIKASTAIDVVYNQSNDNTYSASITAPENLLSYVVSEQSDNTLSFSLKGVNVKGDANITVTITSPALTNVNLSGACNFSANSISQPQASLTLVASGASDITINNFTIKDFSAQLSGASELKISAINASDINIDASGASGAVLNGTTQNVVLNASGASNIKAAGLKAVSGSVVASGASDIKANIKNVTMQSATGSSTIKL